MSTSTSPHADLAPSEGPAMTNVNARQPSANGVASSDPSSFSQADHRATGMQSSIDLTGDDSDDDEGPAASASATATATGGSGIGGGAASAKHVGSGISAQGISNNGATPTPALLMDARSPHPQSSLQRATQYQHQHQQHPHRLPHHLPHSSSSSSSFSPSSTSTSRANGNGTPGTNMRPPSLVSAAQAQQQQQQQQAQAAAGPSSYAFRPQGSFSPQGVQGGNIGATGPAPATATNINAHPANWAAQFANVNGYSNAFSPNHAGYTPSTTTNHYIPQPSTPTSSGRDFIPPNSTNTNFMPTATAGPGASSTGADASSAIDLTSHNIPSPPPPPVNDKRPLCIGSILSTVFMLYPSTAVVTGGLPPPGSKERYDVVDYRGAEMLKVKLKYRQRGTLARKDDPTSVLAQDVIQVMTPGLQTYIGDLDVRQAEVLGGFMARGLVRLEGFVQRLQPEAPQFQVRINVLLFTLPSNVQFIANELARRTMYLLDPIPPYEPARHSDRPRYENAHGGGQAAMQMHILAQRRAAATMGDGYGIGNLMSDRDRERATKVEVERQVGDVFKSIDDGKELEQSDPGPLIKTELFPHQRKALTFMLQREQDHHCLKQARKNAKKLMKKSRSARAPSVEAVSNDGDSVKGKEKEKEKDDHGRSLWEAVPDEKGRIRSWKNKITSTIVKGKKGEKPDEGKGAILADDMGLGKTLSVVSLIAATRSSAHDWVKGKIEKPCVDTPEPEKTSNDVKPSEFRTKVFGMPSMDEEMVEAKGKKRNFEETTACRRSRVVCRSKATLLVCPMSTIANWEEQLREHWNGEVDIVGGAAGVMPPKKIERKWKPPKKDGEESSDDEDLEGFDKLRVYIYHGPSRRPDPQYISEFDVVVTSYTTLGNEFSRQTGVTETELSTPGEMADESGEEDGGVKASDVDEALKKGKKGKGKQRMGSDGTSPLQAIDWFRVVLDEAHTIKSPVTIQSQAACAVEADRRIALTGTPIQNKIDDVWALFKFLRLSPIDEKSVFQSFISMPCKNGEQIGVARLQLIMRCCTLRRTKDSTAEDGTRILTLPARKEEQLWLELRPDEREIYNARAEQAKIKFGEIKARKGLEKGYSNMLQDILRLRQICNHVDLAMSGSVEEDYDGTIMDYQVAIQGIEQNGLTQTRAVAVVCYQKDGDGAACACCGYDFGDHFPDLALGGGDEGLMGQKPKAKKMGPKPVLTKCLHLYCGGCFKSQVFADYAKKTRNNVARSCGACQTMLRLPTDIIEVTPPDQVDPTDLLNGAEGRKTARKKYVRQSGEPLVLSTKMEFLRDELLRLSRKNPNSPHYDPFSVASGEEFEELDADGKPFVTKSVVFSQWTTMLDRISDMLVEAKIGHDRLDGTMTREERTRAIEALKYSKKVEVLLVSTRAGGVGINLTAASRCFLVDPYWNPSVENQAIDRIHRMGQTRPVLATRLMIQDSIEQKLDKIQKKKANLAQLSLSKMSRAEVMQQKAEELAELFS